MSSRTSATRAVSTDEESALCFAAPQSLSANRTPFAETGSRFARNASGALIVEMALIFPIILVLTIGALELGLYLFQANAVQKATQLGARWAVVNLPVSASFQAELNDTSWWNNGDGSTPLGTDCYDPDVTCEPTGAPRTCPNASAGDCVAARMNGLLMQMQRAFPQLTVADIRIEYWPHSYMGAATLGFIGRPGGIPVDVVVSVPCRRYNPAFLAAWYSWTYPALATGCPPASATGFPFPATSTRLSSESFGPPAF